MQGDVSNRCQKMLRDCQNDVCKPSSGFFALMMAAQMCNSIDMYGFESYQKATGIKHKSTPYHYFDEEEGTTDVHSFILIMKVFEFLSHRYPIVIKTPTYGAEKERRKEFQEKAARMVRARGIIPSPPPICRSFCPTPLPLCPPCPPRRGAPDVYIAQRPTPRFSFADPSFLPRRSPAHSRALLSFLPQYSPAPWQWLGPFNLLLSLCPLER